MKRSLTIGVCVFALLSATACTRVDPGYVGVKTTVNGVEQQPLEPRVYWNAPGDKIYEFPAFVQNETFGDDDQPIAFTSGEGSQFSATVTASYLFDAEKAVEVFQRLRQPPDVIAQSYIRRVLVDAMNLTAGEYTAAELYGNRKGEFINKVQEALAAKLLPEGIILEDVSLQSLTPSAEVQASIERVIKANQEAEAAAKEGEATVTRARAQAEANRILSESLSPEVVQYEMIEKWSGQTPITVGGSALINLPAPTPAQ